MEIISQIKTHDRWTEIKAKWRPVIGKLLRVTVPRTDILKSYDDLLADIILLVQCYCQVKLTQAAISFCLGKWSNTKIFPCLLEFSAHLLSISRKTKEQNVPCNQDNSTWETEALAACPGIGFPPPVHI